MVKLTEKDFRSFSLFRDLGSDGLLSLASSCSYREFGPGELIVGHNDTTFDVFFLMSGKLLVNLYSADGQRVGFQEMNSGSMFGEISAVDGLPRSVSVEASTASRVAILPRHQFIVLIEENPGFAMAVARHLAAQVRRLTTRVFEFSTMAVRQRLRAELLRHAHPASGDVAIIEPILTHAELASRISTHREAVSREMAWLDAQGLVAKKGKALFIPSLARFRTLLDEGWEG
ncbi:MAG: Crp/Fnr family transcriptional regulator [Hyphomicrobiales bacterium]